MSESLRPDAAPSHERRRWRQLPGKLAVAAASTLLCLGALEIFFRFVEPDQTPGTTYGRSVIENADGLRDREFAIPKPADTRRVLVLGDSFTWGVGLDVEETIPKLLESWLRERGARAEVVNAAHPGHNTVEQLQLLRETGLRYEPDLVLVLYNLNDIEYLPDSSAESGEAESATPVVEIDPGEDLASYSRNRGLRGAILAVERRSALARFVVPFAGTALRRLGWIQSVEFSWVEKIYQGFTEQNPGWRESRRALTEIAAEGRRGGFSVIVAVYPLFAELYDYRGRQAHRTVLEACHAAGIRAVDLLPLFENTRARSHWIHFMDSHPNARAHRRVAEALLPLVLEELSSAPAPRSAEPSSAKPSAAE